MYGRPVFTPNPKWSQITYVYHLENVSRYAHQITDQHITQQIISNPVLTKIQSSTNRSEFITIIENFKSQIQVKLTFRCSQNPRSALK
ncbi:hypothetical protein HanRHA438_Chr16g0741081 [Helianthus annuus]|nr:hypothetical protein HanRHA438_Chr16g0741081 [Helianthus annuus]